MKLSRSFFLCKQKVDSSKFSSWNLHFNIVTLSKLIDSYDPNIILYLIYRYKYYIIILKLKNKKSDKFLFQFLHIFCRRIIFTFWWKIAKNYILDRKWSIAQYHDDSFSQIIQERDKCRKQCNNFAVNIFATNLELQKFAQQFNA